MNEQRKFYITEFVHPNKYYFYTTNKKLFCFIIKDQIEYESMWTLEELVVKYGAYEVKEEELALLI